MKKIIIPILSLFSVLFFCNACITEEQYSDTPQGNFEALWKIIDEHYCFFDYKADEYGLDWNAVRAKYAKICESPMTEAQLFEVLGNMLAELRDGHVNLYSSANVARYWKWFEDYPANFSDSLQRIYLGTDYMIASGLKYKVLDDNIGYIHCASFATGIGDGNLDAVFSALSLCNGLILDLRDNSGGNLTNAEKLAQRFTNEKIRVGYISHKTGKGHRDFSKPEPMYLTPSGGIRWQKKVVVLTNRRCYSATNDFVKNIQRCPNVITMGDKTGGGSGLPFSSEIPNGWSVRFSACPVYDVNMNQTEFGIDPDIWVSITSFDMQRGIDTIIEAARQYLSAASDSE